MTARGTVYPPGAVNVQHEGPHQSCTEGMTSPYVSIWCMPTSSVARQTYRDSLVIGSSASCRQLPPEWARQFRLTIGEDRRLLNAL